jgi:hypothetical protein
MQGVAEGVTYQQNERVEELNARIYDRCYSDLPLEPNYTPRPVPTKYALFPIIDRKKPVEEERLSYPTFDPYTNFNPGTQNAPPSGYFSHVDTETILRNQSFALQNASQNVYIPSSQSELYNVTVVSRPEVQPYALLFQRPTFDTTVHPNMASSNIGKETFYNHTRTQLRDGL